MLWLNNGDKMTDYITKDSGERETWETGSRRDTQKDKLRFDLVPLEPLIRLVGIYTRGAAKYGDFNWQKGQPLRRYYSSMYRHMMQWAHGENDEDHLAAVAWNAFAIMWTEDMIKVGKLPENLKDMPLEFDFDSLHPNEVTPPDFDTISPIDDAPPNAETDPIAKIRAKKHWDHDRWADDGGINIDKLADHIEENKWKQYNVIGDEQKIGLLKWVETKIGNLEVQSSGNYFAGDTIFPPNYNSGEHKP